jgi:hypothetical protein
MVKRAVLLALIVFAVATALSMRLDAMSDGYTTLGFPVAFLQYTGGKCVACAQYFKWHARAFDLFIALLFACGCLMVSRLAAVKSQ